MLKRAFQLLHRVSPRAASALRRRLARDVRYTGHGRNNHLLHGSSILRNVTFHVEGSDNVVEIVDSTVENVTFRVLGDHHRVMIGPRCKFEAGVLMLEDHHGEIVVGAGSTFVNAHLAVTEPGCSITVGEDCMFAYDIDVRTGDSHAIFDVASGARLNPGASVRLGKHVWVASRCIVLKGVELADHTIIAAGSVVTKSCARPGVILAGNPARVVKEGITWSRKRDQPFAPRS